MFTFNAGQVLHLLVQQGYFDLARPMLASKHYIAHLDITPKARKRIRMAYYQAGHMDVYTQVLDDKTPQ